MLKKGYLASNIMYVSIYHNALVVNRYLKKLEPIFKKIESLIMEKAKYLDEFSYNNLKYKSDSLDDLGLQFDRIFLGTKGIPDNIIEILYDKRFFQSYYFSSIERRMKNDQELIDIIKGEINLE